MENAAGPIKLFKYQNYFDNLGTPCPPNDFEDKETIAFRWVFESLDEEQSFLPQYIKQPHRFLPEKDPVKCQALGLSLYNSQENAQARFNKLKRRMLDRVYGLGTNIAKGLIPIESGVSNLPDEFGHLTFHPYQDTVLKNHFQIISSL